MANNNNEGAENSLDSSKESGLDQSFVGKFVSGLLNNTPLSKWFGPSKSMVRTREDDDDEDGSYSLQPPVKRAKLPNSGSNNYIGHVFDSPVIVHHASNKDNMPTAKVHHNSFPEPVAGPSGIKTRNLFEKHNSSTSTISNLFDEKREVINGEHESDSDESTSGYSSAPKLVNKEENAQNINVAEKSASKTRSLFTPTHDGNVSRSLFTERSPQVNNTSLSSRRPAFNASTFGSPNFVDRTLSTKRIMSSPFYSGNTIYGGASAYGRRLGCKNVEELQQSPRVSIQIKPVNEKKSIKENATLSKTARRILSTLEQYSTPISDAKKIPIASKKEGILSKYVGATPYIMRDRKRPITKELQVPSIPDLLQMKQKERLQNTTESVRQIATTSKSTLNQEKEYKLRSEQDGKVKHTNKMKSSVTASVRQKSQPVEILSDIKLPKVSLPITTLPKFDFALMPPKVNEATKAIDESPSKAKSNSNIVIDNKQHETTTSRKSLIEINKSNNYIFSKPLVISDELRQVSAINCFKFSEPVSKKNSEDSANKMKFKNNGDNISLKKGFGEEFKLTSDKWECAICMVRNSKDDVKCVACTTPKSGSGETTKSLLPIQSGFGDKFKPLPSTWECPSCLIRNKNELEKCAACQTVKIKPILNNFGDKFKPANDTWECPCCMIRNKNSLDKCEACQSLRNGSNSSKSTIQSFGDKFKPASDTWECPTCMIRNKNEIIKCVACETLKPGSSQKTQLTTTPTTSFSFGIKTIEWECKNCSIKNKHSLEKCSACQTSRNAQAIKNSFGDVFKMKQDEWECGSCMVRNKSTTNVCVCCGVSKSGKSSEKLAEIEKETEKKSVNSFNFGIDKNNTPPQFQFGIPTSKSEVKEVVKSTPPLTFGDVGKSTVVANTNSNSSSFTFGINAQEKSAPVIKSITSTTSETNIIKPTPAEVPVSTKNNPLLKPNEKLPEEVAPAPIGFKFGLDSSNLGQSKPTNDSVNAIVSSSSKTETVPAMFTTNFDTSTKPTFQFKPATTTINGDLNNKSKDLFSVKPAEGSNSSNNIFGISAPTFKFDAKPPDSAALFKFGSESAKKSFGDIAATGENTGVSNGFGAAPAPKIPSFGGPQSFGSSENKPFAFGGDATSSKNPTFTFGHTEKSTTASAPVFNFGSVAPTSGFNFSASATPSSGFNFGGTPKVENPSSSFSSTSSNNVFGGAASKNGSFNFGTSANNNNQKAIFTFGASQTNQTPPSLPAAAATAATAQSTPSFALPTQTGFNFGAVAPPTGPPGGFNFSGAPPSFNFTDGGAPGAQPQRKFKKALRRVTHR